MLTRRDFIAQMAAFSVLPYLPGIDVTRDNFSTFSKKLKPLGRILEMDGWYVWCSSAIEDDHGKTHLFFSRWPATKGMGGWINSSEIAHAIADIPEGPFRYTHTVLAPRGPGFWDGTTCHNPHIQRVDGKYALFYMGNANGKTDTKRIGLALADSPEGPWRRPDHPLLLPGESGAWDDHCTTNPAFLKHPNGQYWLYYKSWNTRDYANATGAIRGNRKYGLAIATALEGPYEKHGVNPVVDFSKHGDNRQFEDAFVWCEDDRFKMIARDMGMYNHEVGLYFDSTDGLEWPQPQIAYREMKAYVAEPPPPAHLKRYGRLERPQLLMRRGKPAYLYTAAQGGKYMTSSGFVFKIEGAAP